MSLPFSLAGVDELFVETYDGFDREGFARTIGRLGTGSSSGDTIIQTGALPLRRANLTGVSYDADDVATIRGYSETKAEVDFTDGDGVDYSVVVFDFSAKAFTGRWSWTMTLLAMEE